MLHEEKWIIFVLIVVFVILGTQYRQGGGGPLLSPKSNSLDFLFPKGNELVPNKNQDHTTSPNAENTKPVLELDPAQSEAIKPENEYIILQNTGSGSVQISGLKLKNKRNELVTIPQDENGNPIFLKESERAIISTGQSPTGLNFKLNTCSGYLNSAHKFVPTISSSCPLIKNVPSYKNLDDSCTAFVDEIFSCKTPVVNAESGINNECSQFVSQHANYHGCINDFKKDKDFEKKEWRIYLNRSQEFWDNTHEKIQLINSAGKVISETSY